MKRALATLILRLSDYWLDDTLSESRVRSFLSRELAHPEIQLDIRAPSPAEVAAWLKSLPEGKAFDKGVVRAGMARCMDALEAAGDTREPLVDETLERVLRHIEIKRRKSLSQFDPQLSSSNTWIERCYTQVWFSRAARRRRDLRLLNAALKLQDWLIQAYRPTWPETLRVHTLYAVAETEEAFAEIAI